MFTKKEISKSRAFFVKIFLYIVICISVTLLLSSSILYVNFQNIALTQTYSYMKDNLTQISYSSLFMTNSLKTLAIQLMLDQDVRKIIYKNNHTIKDFNNARSALNDYRSTMYNIISIYVYNGANHKFYKDTSNTKNPQDWEEFFDKDLTDLMSDTIAWERLSPIARSIPSPENYYDEEFFNGYTFIHHETGSWNKDTSAVIVNISEDWIHELISLLDSEIGDDVIIIDETGNLMITSNNYTFLDNISDEEYVKRVLDASDESGYFIDDIDNEKSLITYVTSDSLGWKFIQVTPYDSVVGKINDMKRKTIIIVFLILLCGILITLFASRLIKKPYDNVINKLKRLETDKRNNLYDLKQGMLKRVILSGEKQDMNSLKQHFEHFNIALDINENIALVMFKIDKYYNFSEKFSYEDREIFKFGVMNIVNEIIAAKYTNETVNMGEDHIVAIINYISEDKEMLQENINSLLEDVQNAVLEHLGISLTAVVGRIDNNMIFDMAEVYKDTIEKSNYKLFYGYKSIIYCGEIENNQQAEYEYPISKEKVLINSILNGKYEESCSTYKKIVDEVIGYSCDDFNLVISRILMAVKNTVDTIKSNSVNDLTIDYNFTSFHMKLMKSESLDEINQMFYQLFGYIEKKVKERKNSKNEDLINKVMEIIQEGYEDQNLCIQSIADHLNISAAYLGRMFKSVKARSITDYINEIRIDRASELLLNTDDPISDIADRTGFSSKNYFHSVFKKKLGVTPKEFRQKKQ